MKTARPCTRWPFNGSRWGADSIRLAALLLLVTGCGGQHKLPGHVVGNGGGLILQRFESAREDARDAVMRLTDERLAHTGMAVHSDDRWLVDNRDKVAAEIMHMPWADPEDNRVTCPQHGPQWCLCTEAKQGARLWLNEAGCAASHEEAGELMLHEALHHFIGTDEARVYRLSTLVYKRWASLAAYRAPSPISAPDDAAPSGISGWNGEELVTWNPRYEDRIYRFRTDGTWSTTALSPRPPWQQDTLRQAQVRSHAAILPTDGDHIFVVGESTLYGENEDNFVPLRDISINLEQGTWTDLGRVSLPSLGEHPIMPDLNMVVHGTKISNMAETVVSAFKMISKSVLAPVYALYPGLVYSPTWSILTRRFYFPQIGSAGLDWKATELPVGTYWQAPVLATTARGILFYSEHASFPQKVDSSKAIYFDRQNVTWSALGPGGPQPQRNRILVATDGDSLHVVGKQWMAWSFRKKSWELISSDVGALTDWSTQLFMTKDGALFWDDRARRGVIWAR